MSGRARALATLFDKDLATLRAELDAYPDDATVWRVEPGVGNSAGTLVLHVTGNLRHFVGASLGGTGYERDRDAEFSDRGVPREALVQAIEETREVVARTLDGLGDAALDRPFPGKAPPTLGDAPTTGVVLVYMYGHFTYHLGQLNYHRRLLTGGGAIG